MIKMNRFLFLGIMPSVLLLSNCSNSVNTTQTGIPKETTTASSITNQVYWNGTDDVTVLKSIIPYEEHIQGFAEENHGAHYYIQSPYSTNYRNAIATVDLSQASMNLLGFEKRIAYVSFGVLAKGGICDIGLKNVGTGWLAYCYSSSFDEWWTGTDTISNAEKIAISIDVSKEGGNDIIAGYFDFQDANGNSIKTSYHQVVRGNGQIFESSLQLPLCRFFRFMSLVPYHIPDINDGSYLKNVKFTSLQLYNTGSQTYEQWDINSNLVEYAWTVQSRNIQLTSAGTEDICSIDHVSLYAPFIYGDVNGDNVVNSTDYALMKRYILGIITDFPYENGLQAADVNADGAINSTDYALMKRFILGLITIFPADE